MMLACCAIQIPLASLKCSHHLLDLFALRFFQEPSFFGVLNVAWVLMRRRKPAIAHEKAFQCLRHSLVRTDGLCQVRYRCTSI